MEYASKEQEHRHKQTSFRDKILSNVLLREDAMNGAALLAAFAVMAIAMYFSWTLIFINHETTSGSILGGGTVVATVAIFVKRSKGRSDTQTPQPQKK